MLKPQYQYTVFSMILGAARTFSTTATSSNSPSTSVATFLAHIKKEAATQAFTHQSRYTKPVCGLVWKTSDPKLKHLMQAKKFKGVLEEYGFAENSPMGNTMSENKTVLIKQFYSPPTSLPYKAFNICAGGIPALWAAYIQSRLYKSLKDKEWINPNTAPPVYIIPPNLMLSAAYGSSLQFHIWHAMAMYVQLDPRWNTLNKFGTANILRNTAIRNSGKDNPESTTFPVGEIYPAALLDPKVLHVGMGYAYNELKFKFRHALGLKTYLDETLALAVDSGNVMDAVGKELGTPLLLRNGTFSITDTAAGTEELQLLSTKLKKEYNITAKPITAKDAFTKGGTEPDIAEGGSIWEIDPDGNLCLDFVQTLLTGFKANGGMVTEGTVTEILTDNHDRVTGMVVQSSSNERLCINTRRTYTSFGVGTTYKAENSMVSPVSPVIAGTGYSGMLVIAGKTPITRNYDRNNTHFTPMRNSEGHVLYEEQDGIFYTLVKSTCGGAIAAPAFCIDHAENSLFIARKTFPEHAVHILAARSCYRPISYQNSVHIQRPSRAKGLIAAYGWSGTGITHAPSIAVRIALELAGDATHYTNYTAATSFVGKEMAKYLQPTYHRR